MRKATWVAPAVFLLISLLCPPPALCQDDNSDEYFSPDQLDNLLAPIALYPDPLLAQVLLAATFPDQIDEAARFVRGSGDDSAVDDQPWDVSVKAVAHYQTVLQMMADKLDWTTALGQAYVNQSTDVMASVQRLREEARSAGNLETTPQQQVVYSGDQIEIWPAQPEYIYVPVYDPEVVFFGRVGFGPLISFGPAFRIGIWLNHDFDWREHRIYYHGWDRGPAWVTRARPYVRVTNVYVNNNYRNVVVNRTVVNRTINYRSLNRYRGVHRNVNYDNIRARNAPPPRAVSRPQIENKVVDRNFNPRDPRIDSYRGRPAQPPPPMNRPELNRPPVNRPDVRRPEVNRPEVNRPEVNRPPMNRPEANRPDVSRPPMNRPEVNRPPVQAQPSRERPENLAFGGNRGGFDERSTSQRGQNSRAEAARPPVRPQPPPRAQQPQSRGREGRNK